MKTRNKQELIDSVEIEIGDIVSELINKYYGDFVETDRDYSRVLRSITRQVEIEVFKGKASPEEVLEYLRKIKSKKGIAKLVLSYMISNAIERSE